MMSSTSYGLAGLLCLGCSLTTSCCGNSGAAGPDQWSNITKVALDEPPPVLFGDVMQVGSHPLRYGASDAWFVGELVKAMLEDGVDPDDVCDRLASNEMDVRFLALDRLIVVFGGGGRAFDGERVWLVQL